MLPVISFFDAESRAAILWTGISYRLPQRWKDRCHATIVGHWAIVLVPGSWSIGSFEVMEGIHPISKLISKVITLWQFQIAI